jgi:MFS family permease
LSSDRLFTGRFVVMCAFTFTVFVSVFQLLPTAPYHILDLGGSTTAAGLFLGLLTYASASSAPFTGAIVDRVGERRVLIGVSLVLAGFSGAYALIGNVRWLLVTVFVHGVFWSGLLAASGAYMTSMLPPARRAEGIGYWGLMSVSAIALAPPLGFVVYHRGWTTLCVEMAGLNVLMALIAWRLPPDHPVSHPPTPAHERPAGSEVWRVIALSATLGFVSFGYGGLTSFSALFADAIGVAPRTLFLTAMSIAILAARLTIGRAIDRLGHRRVLVPCLVVPAAGLAWMSLAHGRTGTVAAALTFGAGFGLMYPAYAAYVIGHVDPRRRGSAYGAIIAAFDMGIGTGSSALGWIIARAGFRVAFGAAAVLALGAAPYFVVAERRLGFKTNAPSNSKPLY